MEDLSVLWLFVFIRLFAELPSLHPPLPFLFVELMETWELPSAFEFSPERMSFCWPRAIGRLILQQIVTSLW